MKYLRFLITVLILQTIYISPLFAEGNYLYTPRIIRIGLDLVGSPEKSYITTSNGFIEITDISKKKKLFNGKASKLTITARSGGNIHLSINEQSFTASSPVAISNRNPRSETISLTPPPKKVKTYRGILEVRCQAQRLHWVNLVDMEDYLKSVVPSEISTRAPTAAIEAQTIAARTYAVRNIDRHTKKENYNLCDTVHCQAYFGVSKEEQHLNSAIKATEGKILVFADSPANTVYHSNCGGYIISSQTAWGGQNVPYLIGHFDGIKGQKSFCEYGKLYLSRQPNITLPEKSKRLVIGVTSNNSKKKTHNNYGHRVGMCQDGAMGMALIGYSCSNILGFYYPKTKIETLAYAAKNTTNKFAPTKVTSLAELKSNKNKNKLEPPKLPLTETAKKPEEKKEITIASKTVEITQKPTIASKTIEIASKPTVASKTIELTSKPTTASKTIELTSKTTVASKTIELTSKPVTASKTVELTSKPIIASKTIELTSKPATASKTVELTSKPTVASKTIELTSKPATASKTVELTSKHTVASKTVEIANNQINDKNRSSKSLEKIDNKTTDIDTNNIPKDNSSNKNKLKAILKEIGDTKPNTAFVGIRKTFWSPTSPSIITQSKLSRRKK